MADDSASSKGVSRGDSSGTKGSGSTKTSTGSVSKSSTSKSTGSGNKSGVGGGGGGGGGSTGTRGSSVGTAAGSNNRNSGSGSIGSKGGGASTQRPGAGGNAGKVSSKGTGSGSIGSKGGGASTQRPGAGGNAGQVKGSTLARAEATNYANRERSTRNVGTGSTTPDGAFGPRRGFGNYLSTEQSLNTPTAGLGSYVKDPSRIQTVRTDLGVAGVPGGVEQRYVQDNALDPYKGRPRGGVAGIASAGPVAARPETPGSYPAAPKVGASPAFGGFARPEVVGSYPAAPGIASTTIAARPEVVGSYPAQGIGSLPAPPSITDAQQASWEQSNALARAAANPAYVSLSNLATGAPEASMAFANPQARWKAFNSVNPITESAPPVTVAVRPELPGSYPLASLNINRTPPSDIPPGGIQRVATPFGVDFGSVRTDLRDQIGTAANQVALSRGPVTQVAETPSYGPETPSYDYGGFDLPDPQAPTKQYVGVTYPGMETYSPPTYGGNNNQGSAPIQIIPTSGPATPTTPTVPTPPTTGTGSTTAPGNEWFKYYGTPQPYQTLVATPAPVIMNPAPISQGAGSLLPNIVVKPVFG